MDSESSGIFNYIEHDKVRATRVPHALAIAASTVIILAGIQAASGLVGPILLALFLAVILLVPLRWLQRHGCPQFLAFLLVLACTIALFVGITYFVGKSLNNFIGKIPAYKNRFVEKYAELETQLGQLGFAIGELGDKILPKQKETSDEPALPDEPVVAEPLPTETFPAVLPDQAPIDEADHVDEAEWSEYVTEEEPNLLDDIPTLSPEEVKEWLRKAETVEPPSLIALDPSVMAFWLTRVMLYLRGMLEGGFLVLIFTIFMLFEAAHLPAKVGRAFGKDSPINIEHFHRIAEDIRRYLFLKTLANLMSGSAAMLVYFMFGVPAWMFWGIIAFFMYYIPNIGGTLAAVIPGILILMSPHPVTGGIPGVLLYAVCLLTIECTIAYGIEPRILGHGLRLSTLVIILSLFFWGFLLGPIGLFLAAPLTVMIKIILQAFPETRWLAIFLDGSREKH